MSAQWPSRNTSHVPSTALRFHHLGVAVPDLHQATSLYQQVFGYRRLSGPFDDPVQDVTVCFLGDGRSDMVVELAVPLGPESKVRRILAKGAGAYHVCYEVKDIEAAVLDLEGRGWLVLGEPVPAVAFDRRRIAWLYAPTRQVIELLESVEE